MPTLLELTQAVAFRSRTVQGQNRPTALSPLSGRLARCLDWTQWAWREIQTHRRGWLWMRREFSGAALSGLQMRTAADFGLTRWRSWVYDDDGWESGWSVYNTADGVADERPIRFVDWADFRRLHMRGETDTGAPDVFTIDPQGRVMLSPTPDADYTLRGEYMLAPQPLTAATDVPEMPEAFHDLIVLRALVLLNESDEGAYLDPLWRNRAQTMMAELEAEQLPRVRRDREPLA